MNYCGCIPRALVLSGLAMAASTFTAAPAPAEAAQASGQTAFTSELHPFLTQYCISCHGQEKTKVLSTAKQREYSLCWLLP